jgi:hypothetical protein
MSLDFIRKFTKKEWQVTVPIIKIRFGGASEGDKMGLGSWVIKRVVQSKGEKMFTKIRNSISGYKTYVLMAFGMIVAVAGHFWGPFNVVGMEVPAFSTPELWAVIWKSMAGVFMRNGIAKTKENPVV